MPDKLTDKEVVKALEDTLHRIKGAEHLIVPKEGIENLCNGLENALDLINRQKTELNQYAQEQHELMIEKDKLFDIAEKLKAENERYKKYYFAHEYDKWEKELKSEAYKEFAERLKDMSEHFWEEKENFVSEEQIDNLLKELVGENNGKEKE